MVINNFFVKSLQKKFRILFLRQIWCGTFTLISYKQACAKLKKKCEADFYEGTQGHRFRGIVMRVSH